MIGENVCTHCSEKITNPICEKCYTRQLALWLNDTQMNPAISSKIIKKIRQNLSDETLNDIPCIICNTESVSTCTYCYFFKVENILKNLNLPEEFIEDYKTIFNYKLYKAFYSTP
jgi:hypothetical protein